MGSNGRVDYSHTTRWGSDLKYRGNGHNNGNGRHSNGPGSNGVEALKEKNYSILRKELSKETDRGIKIFAGRVSGEYGILSGPVYVGLMGLKPLLKRGIVHAIEFNLDCARECNGSRKTNTRLLQDRYPEFLDKSPLTALVNRDHDDFSDLDPYLFEILEVSVLDGLHPLLQAKGKTYPELVRNAWPDYREAHALVQKGLVKAEELISLVREEYKHLIKKWGPIPQETLARITLIGTQAARQVVTESICKIYGVTPQQLYEEARKKTPA